MVAPANVRRMKKEELVRAAKGMKINSSGDVNTLRKRVMNKARKNMAAKRPARRSPPKPQPQPQPQRQRPQPRRPQPRGPRGPPRMQQPYGSIMGRTQPLASYYRIMSPKKNTRPPEGTMFLIEAMYPETKFNLNMWDELIPIKYSQLSKTKKNRICKKFPRVPGKGVLPSYAFAKYLTPIKTSPYNNSVQYLPYSPNYAAKAKK